MKKVKLIIPNKFPQLVGQEIYADDLEYLFGYFNDGIGFDKESDKFAFNFETDVKHYDRYLCRTCVIEYDETDIDQRSGHFKGVAKVIESNKVTDEDIKKLKKKEDNNPHDPRFPYYNVIIEE